MPQDDYLRMAWCYDTLIEPFNRSLRPIALRVFQPVAGAAILEVGCGTGMQLAFYRRRGFRPMGIDLSKAMLGQARRRLGPEGELCQGDAARLPFPSQSFDWALATLALHEMAADTRVAVLGEMRRVIRASGSLGIVDYHPEPAPTPKGWTARLMIRCIEFAAGRQHYAHYRHFLSCGGIPKLAARHGLAIARQKRVSGGNIGIYKLRRDAAPNGHRVDGSGKSQKTEAI
jgi:ubiquinone/menaquinone biosynthesis C-methylase UbiE